MSISSSAISSSRSGSFGTMGGTALDNVVFLGSSSRPAFFSDAALAGVDPPPAFFLRAALALPAACFFAGFLAADFFATFFADPLAFVLAGRFFAGRFLVFAIYSLLLIHKQVDDCFGHHLA